MALQKVFVWRGVTLEHHQVIEVKLDFRHKGAVIRVGAFPDDDAISVDGHSAVLEKDFIVSGAQVEAIMNAIKAQVYTYLKTKDMFSGAVDVDDEEWPT